MSEEGERIPVEHQSSVGRWILILLAVVFVAASVYAHVTMHSWIESLRKDLNSSQAQVAELKNRVQTAEASEETLAHQLGMTKKELAQRASQLQVQQRAAEQRLETAQKEQITQVSGEVAGVKTDVGGVKSDVASTKAELEATKAKLQSTIGDLGVQSGLIATTRGDLETLKHRGDRNYYEFTLLKGAKRGKYTMNVTSDDKTIEKKDRNVAEPIQFYSGRDHLLFELVLWTVDKNKATGYLSTPKNAPVPVTAN